MPHGSWARRYAAPLRGRPLLRVAQRKDEDFVPLSNNTTQKRSVNFKRGLDTKSNKGMGCAHCFFLNFDFDYTYNYYLQLQLIPNFDFDFRLRLTKD